MGEITNSLMEAVIFLKSQGVELKKKMIGIRCK